MGRADSLWAVVMTMKVNAFLAGLALASTIGGAASAASILGDTIQEDYNFPTAGNVIETQVVTDPGSIVVQGLNTVTYTANQIIIQDGSCGCYWTPEAQNGPFFTDLTKSFTSFAVDSATNYSDFTATLNSGVIQINWSGHSITPGDELVLDVSAGVPEPTTWAMMLVGFGGLGVAMRSRRKVSAATA